MGTFRTVTRYGNKQRGHSLRPLFYFMIFILKNNMKKIIKLTESDLTKLVKKIIKEQRIDDSIPYEKEYQTSLQKLENKDYVDIKINDLPQRLKKYAEENEMDGIFRIHKSDSNKYLYMKPQKDTTEYQVFNFNMEEFNKYANVVDFYVKNQDLIDKFQDMI